MRCVSGKLIMSMLHKGSLGPICPAEDAPTLSRPEEDNPTAAAAQMQNCSRVNECVKLHLKVPQSLTSTDSEHHSPNTNYLLLAISIHVFIWVSVHLSVRPSIHASRHFTTSVDSWNAIDRLPIAAKRRKTLATHSLNQIASSTSQENNKTQVRKAQHTAAAMRLHVDTRVEVCLLWRRWPLPRLG